MSVWVRQSRHQRRSPSQDSRQSDLESTDPRKEWTRIGLLAAIRTKISLQVKKTSVSTSSNESDKRNKKQDSTAEQPETVAPPPLTQSNNCQPCTAPMSTRLKSTTSCTRGVTARTSMLHTKSFRSHLDKDLHRVSLLLRMLLSDIVCPWV